MTEKLFLVLPGEIVSINDWDRHYIDARRLMRLFGVHPRECIVIHNEQDLQGQRDVFDRGLEVLKPMVHLYRPYDERGRQVIRERIAKMAR